MGRKKNNLEELRTQRESSKGLVFLQLEFRREGVVRVCVFLCNSLPSSSSAFLIDPSHNMISLLYN